MAKFHDKIGYGETLEQAPGVWEDVITERTYSGDVIKNSRRLQEGEQINDDLTVGNSISIVADAYANEHFFAIRYVRWAGTLWKVTNPIYVACRPDPPTEAPPCPQAGVALPTPAEVRRIVDGYNAAITRVAGNTGAVVVDLQAFGDAPVNDPQWIADDGFHPSAEGAEAIAAAFGDALPDEVLELAAAPR